MGIFSKRKINKYAKNPPKQRTDYFTFAEPVGADGTAFKNIDRIASELATLNYSIYDVKTRQRVKKHPLYAVLKEPNLDERHTNFFYQSVKDYFKKGIFWKKYNYDGELVSLFRLNPEQVQVGRDATTNRRTFTYNGEVMASDEILYIPSRFGYSTLRGGSAIDDEVPEVFKTASNLEQYTQNSFKNGVLGKRTVIDVSKAYPDITDEQALDIKSSFQAEYSGAENTARPLLKTNGIEYSELGSGTNNQAAELSENRRLQKDAMDSIFQMPSESYDTEKYFLFLYEFAIKPIASQMQDAINSLLDEERFYFEFDYNGLMKVSISQRVDAQTKQINNGTLSIDEVRAQNNLPPIEAGDTHFMPVNMMPWNEEIKAAYMSKQKQIAQQTNDPTDPDTQHLPQGDDKQ